jgi:hypothetical protein
LLYSFSSTQAKIDETRAKVQPVIGAGSSALSIGSKVLTGDLIGATKEVVKAGDDTIVKPIVQQEQKTNFFGGFLNRFVDGILNPARPSYNGFIPALNAASGFMPIDRAIAAEVQNKPVGSELIIANSSETVLTKEQSKGLMRPVIAAPVKNSTTNSKVINGLSVNIYPTPSMDIGAIADTVIAQINQQFGQEIEAQIN